MNTIRTAYWTIAFELLDYLSERAWERYANAPSLHRKEMAYQKAWRRWHGLADQARQKLFNLRYGE